MALSMGPSVECMANRQLIAVAAMEAAPDAPALLDLHARQVTAVNASESYIAAPQR
jgi:hypothetical protein